MAWIVEHDTVRTLIENLDGVSWRQAPVPRRWHRCQPQTRGWLGIEQVYRCACGAISHNGRHWMERNSRRRS